MKVLIASDSYKGSLSSLEVANAIEKGIKKVVNDATIIKVAIADGGEGTLEALVKAKKGSYQEVEVVDPLGRKINSSYGILDKRTVIIEMATASGLILIKESEYAPLHTTTYGTGQLIVHALEAGYQHIYIGIGGSATNDGGVGMAQALGVLFYDKQGKEIGYGNKSLASIDKIDISKLNPLVKKANFSILSDVKNPLCGVDGAAHIFGRQKGASTEEILIIDDNLSHYADKIQTFLNIDIRNIQGSGAAGGLGAGLIAFCNAKIFSGVEKILEIIDFKQDLRDVDLLITGEGKIDGQTIFGKAPVGIAKLAKKNNVYVVAIVGSVGEGAYLLYDYGVDAIVDIIDKPMTLKFAIDNAAILVENATANFMYSYVNFLKLKD